MNEFLYHSPSQRDELAARHEGVREAVAASRRRRPAQERRTPHGGVAALAALFGAHPRHRAA